MAPLINVELWRRLRQAALVEGEMPPHSQASTPWTVRLMLGVAGWIGALFLLGFFWVWLDFSSKQSMSALACGLASCAIAWAIFRSAGEHDFATQFGFALSLSGQAMVFFELQKLFELANTQFYLVICVFEIALALYWANFMHRVFSGAAAMIALWLALSDNIWRGLVPAITAAGFAVICFNPRQVAGVILQARPIAYGFALALLCMRSADLMYVREIHRVYGQTAEAGAMFAPWLASALMALVWLAVVWKLLQRQQIVANNLNDLNQPNARAGIAAVVAAILLAALSFKTPGVIEALLILLLGFAIGNRILLGLGLFALASFLSHYYYSLQTTLLVKSMILALLGAALLLARGFLRIWLPPSGASEGING